MNESVSTVDDPQHIAFYLPSLRGGGAEKVLLNIAREFASRGHTVDMVLVSAHGEYLDDVPESVQIVDLNSRRFFAALPGLVRYLKEAKPDAMLSTIDTANIVAICATRLAGADTRAVIRISNTISTKEAHGELKHRAVHEIAKRVYPYADGIIAVSDGVAQDLVETMNLDPALITTIYNPSVTPELLEKKDEPVDHSWFDESVPVILGVGEFTEQKDFATLVRAFNILIRDVDARLVILGKGPKKAAVEREIEQLGLFEYIDLPGFVDNPYAYMSNADVFVLSSRWEGCPNVLIEALACGVPVVSTDCPNGPREILEDGKWGELVEVKDSGQMASALQRNIPSKDTKSAQKYAETRFSAGRIAGRYVAEVNYYSKR